MYITPLEAGLPTWTRYPDDHEKRRRGRMPEPKEKEDVVELSDADREPPKEIVYRRG